MKAILLAAGLGTRLRPLTDIRAKPAIPVVGQTLIERIVRWVRDWGINEIVVNLHYRPDSITAVLGTGGHLDVRITYSHEDPILGTAGGPRKVLEFFGGRSFVVVNGDSLTDVDLSRMADAHASSGAVVTMAVSPALERRYGGVLVAPGGGVTGFGLAGAPAAGGAFHFVGVQIAEPAAFASLPVDVPAETVREVYPALIRQSAAPTRPAVMAFITNAPFRDFGTPGRYLRSCLELLHAEGHPPQGIVGAGSAVHPSARLTNAIVGRGCHVAGGAAVQDSVLWDDIVVSSGTEITRCIVADGVSLPPGASLADSVIVRSESAQNARILPLA